MKILQIVREKRAKKSINLTPPVWKADLRVKTWLCWSALVYPNVPKKGV